MAIDNPFLDPAWLEHGAGYTIDFTLALVFFTAICFSVLGKRLGHRRSAAAVSASLGLALAIALVVWEARTGWRLVDLGPIAAGLMMIVMAMVIHQAIRRVGGTWAGGAVGLGAAMLVGVVLDLPWGLNDSSLGALATLIMLIGAGMWLTHHQAGRGLGNPESGSLSMRGPSANPTQVHAVDDLRRLEQQLGRSMDSLDHATQTPPRGPDQVEAIRNQLAQLIPAEGEVTRRLAQLRARAVLVEKGSLARLRDLTGKIPRMTPEQASAGARQLRLAYREAGYGRRIERLDRKAVEIERRVQRLTAQAQALAKAGQTQHLHELIHAATQLQRHAQQLLNRIERDERQLLELAARESRLVMQQGGDAAS